jgi:hypothetical protein
MIPDSFYMNLPSNSSMDIFTENKVSEFKTMLPKTIYLDGKWEVALTEIHYPCTIQNIDFDPKKRLFVAIKREESPDAKINYTMYSENPLKKSYSSINEIIHDFNNWWVHGERLMEMKLVDNKYIEFKIVKKNALIQFPPEVSSPLGFETFTTYVTTGKAVRPHNMHLSLPRNLYVYTDIIETQIVGDIMAKLLRVLCVNLKTYLNGNMNSEQFATRNYLPVSKKEFNTIEVNIKLDNGKNAPFLDQASLVVLHFRRCQ